MKKKFGDMNHFFCFPVNTHTCHLFVNADQKKKRQTKSDDTWLKQLNSICWHFERKWITIGKSFTYWPNEDICWPSVSVLFFLDDNDMWNNQLNISVRLFFIFAAYFHLSKSSVTSFIYIFLKYVKFYLHQSLCLQPGWRERKKEYV
jgi:hypothetical protein